MPCGCRGVPEAAAVPPGVPRWSLDPRGLGNVLLGHDVARDVDEGRQRQVLLGQGVVSGDNALDALVLPRGPVGDIELAGLECVPGDRLCAVDRGDLDALA